MLAVLPKFGYRLIESSRFSNKTFFEGVFLVKKAKHIAIAAARRVASCRKTLSLVGAGLVTSALPTFAAAGGRLAITQAMNSLSTEINGPLTYGVCLAGLSATAWDFMKHRELGAVGWGGFTVAGAAALAIGAPTALSLIPGAAGFVV